jgi:hypothetical protein
MLNVATGKAADCYCARLVCADQEVLGFFSVTQVKYQDTASFK